MTKAENVMEKLAGSGWDLRAYGVDPKEFQKKYVDPDINHGKWARKAGKHQGKFPTKRRNLKYMLFGGKKRFEKDKAA